jgi:protein TonB
MAAVAGPGPGPELEVTWAFVQKSGIEDQNTEFRIQNSEGDQHKEPSLTAESAREPDVKPPVRDPAPLIGSGAVVEKAEASPELVEPADVASLEPSEENVTERPDAASSVIQRLESLPTVSTDSPIPRFPGSNSGAAQLAMAGDGNLAGILADQTAPVFSEAAVLELPEPAYPRLSRKRGEEGRVVVEVVVSAKSEVRRAKVVRSSNFSRLDRAALKAVERATFSASTEDSVPVESVIRVAYRFELADQTTGRPGK